MLHGENFGGRHESGLRAVFRLAITAACNAMMVFAAADIA